MSKDCCWDFRGTATKKPLTGPQNQGNNARWFFMTAAPNTPDRLRRFSMTGRCLDAATTFEDMCVAFEQAYAQGPAGLLCECCQSAGCESCQHALGWHVCQRDREALGSTLDPLEDPEEKRKAGTLHGSKFDVESNLWVLARRLVPLHVIKQKLDDYIAEGHIAAEEKDRYAQVFEEMLGVQRKATCMRHWMVMLVQHRQRTQTKKTGK